MCAFVRMCINISIYIEKKHALTYYIIIQIILYTGTQRDMATCVQKNVPQYYTYIPHNNNDTNIYPLASHYWLANITKMQGIYYNGIIPT